jgi:hypothetical protein
MWSGNTPTKDDDRRNREYALLRDRPWTEAERTALEATLRVLLNFDEQGCSVSIDATALWIRFAADLGDAEHDFLLAWLRREADRLADFLERTDVQPIETSGSFIRCPTCQRWFDVCDLNDALEHAVSGHRPASLH